MEHPTQTFMNPEQNQESGGSDTPRTDLASIIKKGIVAQEWLWWVHADFARTLERENNALLLRIDSLEQAVHELNCFDAPLELQKSRAEVSSLQLRAERAEQKLAEMREALELAVDMAEELAPKSHTLTCLKKPLTSTTPSTDWICRSEVYLLASALIAQLKSSHAILKRDPQVGIYAKEADRLMTEALPIAQSLLTKEPKS